MNDHEAEEFAALWTRTSPMLNAFLRSLLHDAEQSEEVLQRVAVTLVRKFAEFDRSKPFAPWAIGVAKNEVLYFRRQWATDKLLFDDELVSQLATGFQRLAEEDGPDDTALSGCLELLNGRARTAVWLRYTRSFTAERIAKEMSLSAGAVRMLLCRTRKTLRECIERRQAGARTT
ncbi:RNA polymerase sigma factor [Pirellulimonas nuda]|uniref:RNA polymerase sigma factor n=1 Tax=Pirellulimonas nuda TaxID=2528009 RepID=A0A518DC71_9BACT|nr:sigma-70 family RNA polymerase sigma factor [Pirellulimonas nuda]QDU89081.1 RNA polymerase sigma factor [Pirellulimonas nuda]